MALPFFFFRHKWYGFIINNEETKMESSFVRNLPWGFYHFFWVVRVVWVGWYFWVVGHIHCTGHQNILP